MDHAFSSAFIFLHQIQMKGNGIVKRSFSIAPMTCMKRVKITIDNTCLKHLNNGIEISFNSLFSQKAINMRKNKEIGRSFQTDGCQAILQYIDIVTVPQKGSQKAANKRIDFDANAYQLVPSLRIEIW